MNRGLTQIHICTGRIGEVQDGEKEDFDGQNTKHKKSSIDGLSCFFLHYMNVIVLS